MIAKLLFLGLSVHSQAQVNLRDGGLEIERDVLPIRTYYNSRTLYSGAVGLGWWIDFETRLTRLDLEHYQFRHGPVEVAFTRPPSSSGVWSLQCGKDQTCRVRDKTGRVYTFNSKGQLKSWRLSGGREYYIPKASLGDQPQMIKFIQQNSRQPENPKARYLKLEWQGQRLMRIDGHRLDYLSDVLSEVTATNLTEVYAYSSYGNLKRIHGSDDLSVDYDELLDRVTSLKPVRGCELSFKYSSHEDLEKLRFETERTRICPNLPPMISKHTFEYRHQEGRWQPSYSRLEWNGKIWEVNHEVKEAQRTTSAVRHRRSD